MEGFLKGDLINKINTENSEESVLKGKLLEKTNSVPEESKLKGRLLEDSKEESPVEIFSEEWLKTKVLIQRDGGDRYEVKDIISQTFGASGKRLVKLISLKDGHSLTKEFSDVIEKIKIPGSAWSIEE